jgi:hypothetical protein
MTDSSSPPRRLAGPDRQRIVERSEPGESGRSSVLGGWPALEAELREVQRAGRERLLHEDVRPNVVGVAVGLEHPNGRPTARPALLVLVTKKVARAELAPWARVPARIGGYRTRVVDVGTARPPPAPALTGRWPRVSGGCSVGHGSGTVGTMAAAAYDQRAGRDKDDRLLILSTNHVLASLDSGRPGDPILQPSRFDGGRLPADEIGKLLRSVPIELEPPLPRRSQSNVIDAAIADATSPRVAPGVCGLRPLAAPSGRPPRIGALVEKTGRATGLTAGRVVGLFATVDIRYGTRVARFHDQIVTTPMMEAGDSGALLVGDDQAPIGMLFAGSTGASFANPIERVSALLGIEIVSGEDGGADTEERR